MVAAALASAARGKPVFPCSPVHKRPLVPGESSEGAKDGGLYLATTDEAQIRTWWATHRDALIAMRTGPTSGVVVIDLDTKQASADAMLRALADVCGGTLPPCPLVRTQSGGLHLWFACPAEEAVGNRTNLFKHVEGIDPILAEGVDVRGEGGYVIVPPSVMTNGNAYTWEAEPEPGDPLPPLPAVLLDAILRRGAFARDGAARPGRTLEPQKAADATVRRYALAALDDEARAVASASAGTRNHTLNTAAFNLGQLVAAGALSETLVRGTLEDVARACGLVRVAVAVTVVIAFMVSQFGGYFHLPR